MKVLGVHDGHNAAACLYEDGEIRAALQEERLTRVKNWSGMPVRSVQWILSSCNLRPGDIDWVAVNGHHAAFPMTREQLMHEYEHINDASVTFRRTMRRAANKTELWGTGNRESFRNAFLSRQSLLLWALKTHRRNRERYASECIPLAREKRVIRLQNKREVERFVTKH